MQRKKPKNGKRLANAEEKAFHKLTKLCACIVCGRPGPSIVDHCLGSTFSHLKTLCGHWFVIPLCYECDQYKSTPNGSVARFIDMFGPLCELWQRHIDNTNTWPPVDVATAIHDWGR